ncbi:uncharacterized protein TNCT_107681 [Trichonephila clavata]|uniref:Uncharacterized protein n=1 Tax=Trichonephila clavata TaxID=2740835 RepID=A0A8X6GYX4_TRICU|nr:uncharacterized protein TNCT_107681 [Trichonephila clavata]
MLPLCHRDHPTPGWGFKVWTYSRTVPGPQLYPELLPDLVQRRGQGTPLSLHEPLHAFYVRPAIHLHIRTGSRVQQQRALEAGLYQGEERVFVRGEDVLREEEEKYRLRTWNIQ